MITKEEAQTLKGIAILFVLLGHGYTVFTAGNILAITCLAGTGVFIFLVISGYGLSESYNSRGGGVSKKFIKNRIFNVYVPYVLVVFVESVLLFWLKGRSFSISVYVQSFLGYIDYYGDCIDGTLWYITFILLCYIIFICVYALPVRDGFKLLILWGIFTLGWLSDVYIVIDWKFNYFTFCIGCSLNYIWKLVKLKWTDIQGNIFLYLFITVIGIIGIGLTANGVGDFAKPHKVTIYAFFVFLTVFGLLKIFKHWTLFYKLGKISYFIYLVEGAVLFNIGARSMVEFLLESFVLGYIIYYINVLCKMLFAKYKRAKGCCNGRVS